MGDTNDLSTSVFALLGALVATPLILALDALAVTALWGWFIVPLGAPDVGFWTAAGIAILVGLLTNPMPPKDRESIELILYGLFKPIVALLIGWLVSFGVPS